MRNIEELIKQLCPNGVELKTLGEIANYRRGSFPQPYGEIRWYNGENAMPFVQVADVGKNMRLVENTKHKISKLAQPKSVFVLAGTVIVTLQGSIGRVAITQYDSYVDRTLAIFESYREEINTKYFAYQLESKFDIEKGNARGSTIKTITKEEFTEFKISIPPLRIQQEIVNILDKFTQLEADLEAGLKARRSQYEYYRNELLNFENKEVEWKSLGEVSKILRGTAITEKETISGEFPVVANSPNPIYFHGKSNRSGETIVIARSGAYSGLVSYWNKPFFLTDAFSIHPDNTLVKTKFVYFLLKKEQEKIHLMKKGSGVPHVRAKDFESYSIPIPPLSEQERIVAILDKFDALVNDISIGLPAEIEARRKQFEYYRNKLLSFEPLNN